MTRRTAPSMAAVATAAACVFLVIVLFLAAQLRAGHDPGLGTVVPVAAKQAAAPAPSHSSAPLVTKSSGGG
jgi:hypothetical protein